MAAELRCQFPDCPESPDAATNENGMCAGHRRVQVLGSYVPDRHRESSHE